MLNEAFLRGAWVATVWGIDFPSATTTNSGTLKNEINALVDKASECGLNALFFQVRPSADAFYSSLYFPWSKYLTGKQGVAPSNGFDPFKYIIEKCHEAGIHLHAWINPFRITAAAGETVITTHPATVAPWLTMGVGGKLYFNPGEELARELIIEGVREIVENYDVDGIHFDDYFYPEEITTEDSFTFEGRWNGIDNLADWRRNNIDELIYKTHAAVKEIDPDVLFGVSPSGIWANKTHNPLGSATLGFESYYEIYADSRGWVRNGWVDYIVPQIYWKIGQKNSDFLTVLD